MEERLTDDDVDDDFGEYISPIPNASRSLHKARVDGCGVAAPRTGHMF